MIRESESGLTKMLLNLNEFWDFRDFRDFRLAETLCGNAAGPPLRRPGCPNRGLVRIFLRSAVRCAGLKSVRTLSIVLSRSCLIFIWIVAMVSICSMTVASSGVSWSKRAFIRWCACWSCGSSFLSSALDVVLIVRISAWVSSSSPRVANRFSGGRPVGGPSGWVNPGVERLTSPPPMSNMSRM